MNEKELINQRVTNRKTGQSGVITKIENGLLYVDADDGSTVKYSYPAAFNSTLVLDNPNLQSKMTSAGSDVEFNKFRDNYCNAIDQEIAYLERTGGKTYRAFDGVRLNVYGNRNVYTFETDTEYHFPDGTGLTIISEREPIKGYVISCDEYTITIQQKKYMGEQVEQILFQTDQCMLLKSVNEHLEEMDQSTHPIAYEIACRGNSKIDKQADIHCGQEAAIQRAMSEQVTFIWGPPGTGKTYTLASIALKFIERGQRVLMLSYSNVSVDGALLQVARRSNYEPGMLLRYGYPREEEVRSSDTLASYRFVMAKFPGLKSRYDSLAAERKKTDPKSKRYLELTQEINKITDSLAEKEKDAIQSAMFVATTVSKAMVDKAVYSQRFDLVIFDEASMAYVPQVVFAAGLATKSFVCLGDFQQLPAIVQSPNDDKLKTDIFRYTGIAEAVEADCGHEWLVMLDEQRRMHPDIANAVNKVFYNGRLKTVPESIERNIKIAEVSPASGQAMALVDLSGMYSICTKNGDSSRVNILSALVCIGLAEKYCDKYEVGIITPYNAQSSFISTMLRDLREKDKKYENISCATVHQFQGSEKPIIIYDAVDCYLMPYPGTLLTAQKDDMASRLFNVALTRARGKFILVANKDYLEKKHISKQLLFTKIMNQLTEKNAVIRGEAILKELHSEDNPSNRISFSDREQSWQQYLNDLSSAKSEIKIEIPRKMTDDKNALEELSQSLCNAKNKRVIVSTRKAYDAVVPDEISDIVRRTGYVTDPVTLIDKSVLWFGQPLAANDFISEGESIKTKYFPTVRFCGTRTVKAVQMLLEIR